MKKRGEAKPSGKGDFELSKPEEASEEGVEVEDLFAGLGATETE